MESFLESHLQAKRQTRQFYFLATNFERTRISDPRIAKLEEIVPERTIIPERNSLGEAFVPTERRMRFCDVESIKRNNWAGLGRFISELLRNMDKAGVGVLSEAESVKLYDLLGVDLKLEEFPKNNEFLYDPSELSEEALRPLFTKSHHMAEDLPIPQTPLANPSSSTSRSKPLSSLQTTDRTLMFAKQDKFINPFEFVKLEYLKRAVTETVFSKLMFDQARSEFTNKREKRANLAKQLVQLRLGDLFTVFKKLLSQMDLSDCVSITAATDALNSIEDKVITHQENASIKQHFEALQEAGKIPKATLISLIVSEKAQELEQELFAYQMDFFEKFLLDQFQKIKPGDSSMLSFLGLSKFLDQVEEISISSRQKFLLWSFLSSAGCLNVRQKLHFISYVSIVATYLQRVLPQLTSEGYIRLQSPKSNEDSQLATSASSSDINSKKPCLFKRRGQRKRDLSPLIEDNFEDFSKRLRYLFPHLQFPHRVALHLHKELLVWKAKDEVAKLYKMFADLDALNGMYDELMASFVLL